MSLEKLKLAARMHEQRGELPEAIDFYRQAVRQSEAGEQGGDPSLSNKIGDLEQSIGHLKAACEAWEQSAARYGEQGYFNNAIALCRKILRHEPGHGKSYFDLARFYARKKVIHDVRENLEHYLAYMQHQGETEQANRDLLRLATDFPGWRELSRTIHSLLGREPEPDDEPVAGVSERSGGLIFLDPLVEPRRGGKSANLPTESTRSTSDLGLEPTTVVDGEFGTDTPELDGIERASTGLSELPAIADAGESGTPVDGLTGFEVTVGEVAPAERLDGLEGSGVAAELTIDVSEAAAPLDGFEATATDLPAGAVDKVPEIGLEAIGASTSDGIVFLDTGGNAPPQDAETVASTSSSEGDSSTTENPLAVRADAHVRLEHGDRQGAVDALERAMAGYVEAGQFDRAFQVATELIEAMPDTVDRHQARVEIAARMRDPARLCTAYMDLAESLTRLQSTEKAIAVYRRVLELEESHPGTKAALREMVPDAAPEVTAEGFVDFGAMVNDEVGPRSSRMRTETTTISDDEDETFREALNEFKRALDQNIAVEDHQAHYDLGLAFKEMGLLEEAISELQKALRSNEGRLRTSEALGQCFFEQGRPAVAEAVLRSVEKGEESDAEKVGVLYWLGRSLEAQNKTKNARTCYERVLAIDIGFHDVADRLTALADATG